MSRVSFPLLWALVGLLIVALECYTLGLGKSAATLSATMRMIRFDPVGRWILLPLWSWLTMHWIVNPRWLGVTPGWRDAVGLSIGLAIALWETLK
jgi:hypothetical protein